MGESARRAGARIPYGRPMDREFSCEVESCGDTTLVRPVGALVIQAAARLRATMSCVLERGHERIVLDLREVTRMDASGLGAVLDVRAAATRATSFRLVCAPERMPPILRASGLLDHLAGEPAPLPAR